MQRKSSSSRSVLAFSSGVLLLPVVAIVAWVMSRRYKRTVRPVVLPPVTIDERKLRNAMLATRLAGFGGGLGTGE
jgi:hypothetical protein